MLSAFFAGLLLAYAGMAALCQGLERHYKQVWQRLPPPGRRRALRLLGWALLAASFALVGNFVGVSRVMLHELLSWDISAAQLVEKVGLAAAEIPPPVVGADGINSLDRLWELLLRAAVLWYAGFAIWTVLP